MKKSLRTVFSRKFDEIRDARIRMEEEYEFAKKDISRENIEKVGLGIIELFKNHIDGQIINDIEMWFDGLGNISVHIKPFPDKKISFDEKSKEISEELRQQILEINKIRLNGYEREILKQNLEPYCEIKEEGNCFKIKYRKNNFYNFY